MNPYRSTPVAPTLDRRLLWSIYAVAAVPVVGMPLVIVASFVGYYALRRRAPELAELVNRHAWCAWTVAMGVSASCWLIAHT